VGLISWLAERIRTLGPEKKVAELAAHVKVELPPSYEKSHWAKFNKVANFLKHADADHDQAVSEEEVDSEIMLLTACRHYLELMGRMTPEMQVWMAYTLFVRRDDLGPGDDALMKIAEMLRSVSTDNRNTAALHFIRILKDG
jgi:hypothetical protein